MSKTIRKTANISFRFRQPGFYASGEDSKRRVPASNSVKCGFKENLSRIDTLEESIFKGEMVTLNVHFIIVYVSYDNWSIIFFHWGNLYSFCTVDGTNSGWFLKTLRQLLRIIYSFIINWFLLIAYLS